MTVAQREADESRFGDVLRAVQRGQFYSLSLSRRVLVMERLTNEALDSHLVRYSHEKLFA